MVQWSSGPKKKKLGLIYKKNIHFMYKQSVKNRTKTGKNPPKMVVFPAPPTSWLSLNRFGPNLFGSRYGSASNLFPQKFDHRHTLHLWHRYRVCLSSNFWVQISSNRFEPRGMITDKPPFFDGCCPFFVLFLPLLPIV